MKETPSIKVGLGYDIHPLIPGRRFVLGGVEIPFEKGPQGHSDGDCLLHAITDALLGAMGLGDMGHFFPDTDVQWKNVPSIIFLEKMAQMLVEQKLCVGNIDSIIQTEQPKLISFLSRMKEKISEALGCEVSQINIKAKRGEGLDAVGRGEAIAAQAVVLLMRIRP